MSFHRNKIIFPSYDAIEDNTWRPELTLDRYSPYLSHPEHELHDKLPETGKVFGRRWTAVGRLVNLEQLVAQEVDIVP